MIKTGLSPINARDDDIRSNNLFTRELHSLGNAHFAQHYRIDLVYVIFLFGNLT